MTDVKTDKQDFEPQSIVGLLVNRAFDKAKNWAGAVMMLEITIYVGGVASIFIPAMTLEYPWVAFPLAVVGFVLSAYSSGVKDKAECLKRQHEALMGWGKVPGKGELADLQLAFAKALPEKSEALLKEGITYWSRQPAGARRTLENLVESAWYTKHLAKTCAWLLGVVIITASVLSIVLLLLCVAALPNTSAGLAAAKGISFTLVFLISVRGLRSLVAYRSLSEKANATDTDAGNLLSAHCEDSFEVQRLLTEYQVTRASAPLIPTWVWRMKRNSLNHAWETVKHPTL